MNKDTPPVKLDEENSAGKTALKSAGLFAAAFLKWFLFAVLIGGISGVVGAAFHMTIDYVTGLRMENSLLIWFLPVAGVVTLLLYRLCRVSFSAGTNLIIDSVRKNERVPVLLAPLIFLGTALSHLFGASVGREGAALQLGGSIGQNVGRLFKMNDDDIRTLAMCGMACVFSALFGTPIAAAVFVLEVISIGQIRYNAFLPCVVGATTAKAVAELMGALPIAFEIPNPVPEFTYMNVLRILVLAVLTALLSIAFCIAIHKTTHFAGKLIKNPYLRIAAGGLLTAVLTAVFGLYDYNGAGTEIISRAINGEAYPWAFAVKLLLTALCVGVGFRGGEIVPTLFVGATFGCAAAPLLGLDPGFAAAVAMVAMFCCVVNCPFASLFLCMEMFGTVNLPLFAVAIAVSFLLSGYFGLYSSQRFSASKLKDEQVDIGAK